MFLLVADTLIDLLILDLGRADSIDKAKKLSNLNKLCYCKKYEEAIGKLGISGSTQVENPYWN